jgi:phytoene dehydrogenase-like protein
VARAPESLEGAHYDVVVIGAGMAGLAAGIRLALAEKNVVILERHNVSGGLNSFYSIDGRKYDVGLHALTNFVRAGVKGTPLGKLLRQLRIDRESLDLCEQRGSRIVFPGCSLPFTNDFAVFEAAVADTFPHQIDGFRQLVATIRNHDAFDLDGRYVSARQTVREHISDPLLEDMLFCPVMYYGSAEEEDMDFGQFAIMFRSLFFEGFARPLEGVRVIIRALQDKYRSLGGVRKMKCGVQRIEIDGGRAQRLILDNGESLTADKVISTIGSVETLRLCSNQAPDAGEAAIGKLSFVETISVFSEQPQTLGWEDTIIFFSTRERFRYAAPAPGTAVDPTSGVICLPNNYHYGEGRQLDEGILRVTALARHDVWQAYDPDEYARQKSHWYRVLSDTALSILPPATGKPTQLASDMFTPTTVHRYTGHLAGAIYGSHEKWKSGQTPVENVFLAGTDQGFLGIIGAMLSGISIANKHVLQP